MYCRNCGEEIKDGDQFCKKCGAKIGQSDEECIFEGSNGTQKPGKNSKRVAKCNKMKRQLVAVILLAAAVVITMIFIVRCLSRNQETYPKDEGPKKADISTNADRTGNNADLQSKDEKVIPARKIDGGISSESCEVQNDEKRAYEDLLNDTEQVYFQKYNQTSHQYDQGNIFDESKGYTLSELTDALRNDFKGESGNDPGELKDISYSYIDCGNDGQPELALKINSIDNGCDDYTVYYIIKKINDRLQVCYCTEEWSRSEPVINQYGYIKNEGSNGASSFGVDYSFVDADGNWKYVVYLQQEYDMGIFATYPGGIDKTGLESAFSGTEFDGKIVLDEYFFTEFDENHQDYQKYLESEKDSYELSDGSTDNSIYDENGTCRKLFATAGVSVYTKSEIDELILEKEKDLGLTDEVKNGAEIEWISAE